MNSRLDAKKNELFHIYALFYEYRTFYINIEVYKDIIYTNYFIIYLT